MRETIPARGGTDVFVGPAGQSTAVRHRLRCKERTARRAAHNLRCAVTQVLRLRRPGGCSSARILGANFLRPRNSSPFPQFNPSDGRIARQRVAPERWWLSRQLHSPERASGATTIELDLHSAGKELVPMVSRLRTDPSTIR